MTSRDEPAPTGGRHGGLGVQLTLGTAGHIDHGKTALITRLTGTNTDRLREERERGISIELGYAELELPSGRRLSVVDVPGHERFVRTMVAGATGVDLFLLVIAADDGVMPQTVEHLAILELLGVQRRGRGADQGRCRRRGTAGDGPRRRGGVPGRHAVRRGAGRHRQRPRRARPARAAAGAGRGRR